MNIRLKSEELRRFFRNNGVVTETMAKSIFNRINIELVTTTNGKINQDLIDDLVLIRNTYPQLLRHTTIINNTGSQADMQPIIDILATYPNNSFDTLKSLSIKSKYDSDYNLDYSKLKKIERISLSGGNRVSKVTFDPNKLPKVLNSDGNLELELENFDLSGLDLTVSKVDSLRLSGRGTRNFTRANGFEKLKTFSIVNKDLDREFYDMVDFINGPSSNVSTLIIDGVNLSSERPFEMLTSKNLVQLEIKNSKLNSLEGLNRWDGKLTCLEVYNNDLSEKDIPRMMEFMRKHPYVYVDFKNNTGITNYFNSLSTNTFSEHTRRNIYNTLLTVDGPRDVKNKDVLQKIAQDPTIPISIEDAEIIRGQAHIDLNPIEIPDGVNLETIDFNKPYLKGGTLLVSPAQLEILKKFGKLPKDMELAVRINSAKELSSEQIKNMYYEDNVKKVIMMNEDSVENTRTSYTSNEYYHIRNVLDEIVSGIKEDELDFQKFTTVYARVVDNIIYDRDAISKNTPEVLRNAGKQRHNCRNLKNGLLEGKCVCAGYAEILRNALALVGIKSKYLVGRCFDDPDYKNRHAWNAVELEDENHVKQWYYVDATWDSGSVLNGKPRYMLLDEETFNKSGHQVYESYDVPNGAKKEYNRNRIAIAIETARERMLNPRDTYNEKKKAKKNPVKIKREETKKESKPREKSVEELADIEKRENCRRQMNDIYRILESTVGLSSASKRNYYSKLVVLEEKMKELDDKIASYGPEEILVNPKEDKKLESDKKQEESIKPQENKWEMPDIKINVTDENKKVSSEQEREEKELDELAKKGGVGKTLPVIKTREDLIKLKKQNMLEKAEKSFTKFTNKVFGRNDKKPPRFISGIIKFALNTRFWIQDRIRDIRDEDDKIDDELTSIILTKTEHVEKRNNDLMFVNKNEIVPRVTDRKKTIAEKKSERIMRKKGFDDEQR